MHHESYKAFPTAGSFDLFHVPRVWINDKPAVLKEQTWGWMYQVQPFMGNPGLWVHENDFVVLRRGPSEAFCPSRRAATYATLWIPTGEMLNDYSANGGDSDTEGHSHPGAYTGLTPYVGKTPFDIIRRHTGVIISHDPNESTGPRPLRNVLVGAKNVTDGLSKTMIAGEKHVPSNAYQGGAWGDSFAWTQGMQWEGVRLANDPPLRDAPAPLDDEGDVLCGDCDYFGSAHPRAFNAALCDGSVRWVSYQIELTAFQALCNRFDGLEFELPQRP